MAKLSGSSDQTVIVFGPGLGMGFIGVCHFFRWFPLVPKPLSESSQSSQVMFWSTFRKHCLHLLDSQRVSRTAFDLPTATRPFIGEEQRCIRCPHSLSWRVCRIHMNPYESTYVPYSYIYIYLCIYTNYVYNYICNMYIEVWELVWYGLMWVFRYSHCLAERMEAVFRGCLVLPVRCFSEARWITTWVGWPRGNDSSERSEWCQES